MYLLSQSRELEDVERLVEAGRVLVYVDHHGHTASTTEEELQEVGEFGLPEGDVVLEPAETCQNDSTTQWGGADTALRRGGRGLLGVLVKPHGVDALPERQQGAVDVSCLLQTDSGVASSRAAL